MVNITLPVELCQCHRLDPTTLEGLATIPASHFMSYKITLQGTRIFRIQYGLLYTFFISKSSGPRSQLISRIQPIKDHEFLPDFPRYSIGESFDI
jgi:hypothetical protein